MIVLYPDSQQNSNSVPQAIVIFGVGLIGGEIYKNILIQAKELVQSNFEFNWADENLQKQQATRVLNQIANVTNQSDCQEKRIAIIWSAGSAGFYSENAELDMEMRNFKNVLEFTKQLKDTITDSLIEFHLVSSAGGVFEGCGYVDSQTKPVPVRPYGYLKLSQEQLLSEQRHLRSRIYRPSTVYGPVYPGIRCGLVSTLIKNGVLRMVTNILGNLYTLRDYVYSSDIGNFIARTVLQDTDESQNHIFHLASGKPSSIFEIIAIVEHMLKHRVYYKLEYCPNNSCDIVFSPSIHPAGWSPSELKYGCKQILSNWKSPVKECHIL